MGEDLLARLGWFPFCYLAILIVVDVLIFSMVSLSPAATSFVNFYKQPQFFLLPYILVITGMISEIAFDTAIFPIGSYDPDTFPLQMIGYEPALIIAIAWGLILGGFFYETTKTVGATAAWVPVPEMLGYGTGLSTSSNVRDLFSGYNPTGNELANSLPPTFKENSGFMYWLMLPVWVPFIVAGKFFKQPLIFNLIGAGVLVVAAMLLFSPIAHAFAYQEIEPAYNRARFFAGSCMLGVVLTGFPLPCDFGHIGNNWGVTEASIEGTPMVI